MSHTSLPKPNVLPLDFSLFNSTEVFKLYFPGPGLPLSYEVKSLFWP